MANTIETITPGTSSPNPNRLTPAAVIEQVRTLRSLLDDVTPLSKDQRLQLRQREASRVGSGPCFSSIESQLYAVSKGANTS
jgi:hypothetical protein